MMDEATISLGLAEAMGGPLATDSRIETERQRLALRAAAPMRKPVAQDDVDGLALFDVGRSPTLF